MTCEGDGGGTVGFFAKDERVGFVTNKHFAWHPGCKLFNSHGDHIATVENVAGTNVDAAFALWEGREELPEMIDASDNCCEPYEDMEACLYTWKLREDNGSNETPDDINVCITATDFSMKKYAATVKTLDTVSINVRDMNGPNFPLQPSDIKIWSKYCATDARFEVRCKFSYELSANGTNTVKQCVGRVEGELKGSARFSNSTGGKQIEDVHVEVPVEGHMKGVGTFKGIEEQCRLEVSIDFKGTAIKEVVLYEGQIKYTGEEPRKHQVGVGGQSGSLLRKRDTKKAVGLVFAGNYLNQGCANPIEDVLKALGNIRVLKQAINKPVNP